MIILGLHFGHDASVAIIKDGKPLICVERERLNRVRHAVTLSFEDVLTCLEDVDLQLGDIDFVAITSTQEVEYIFTDPAKMRIEYGQMADHNLPCTLVDKLKISDDEIQKRLIGDLVRKFKKAGAGDWQKALPDWAKYIKSPHHFLGDLQHFVDTKIWSQARSFAEIKQTDYSELLKSDELRHGFHFPVTMRFGDLCLPGYIIAHHAAHIGYSYYESPFSEAAILSTDGAGAYGYLGGFFAYARGSRIYPFTPNNINIGPIYDMTAMRLGLGLAGGAGKLMGLSAYGQPKFLRKEFIGNWYDLPEGRRTHEDWIHSCERLGDEMGYDLSALGDKDRVLEPICADIAASTQKLTEEILLEASRTIVDSLSLSGLNPKNLCLGGGVALNCPANTRLICESPFSNIYVPPAINDSGLSLGASLWLYHNVMDQNFSPRMHSPVSAYMGLKKNFSPTLIESALFQNRQDVKFEKISNIAESAAKDLNDDLVIGWFQGRSELGPRALGHRSILANPRFKKNWLRVNQIKKREAWRPFAPAVLQEKERQFFDQSQFPSYFMLLNAEVRSSEIPAVTHVDGSARVQSVNSDCGMYYDLLRAFDEISGLPVVLNTSFNGPGEPIIETPEQAVAFLLKSPGMDALYVGDFRVCRA